MLKYGRPAQQRGYACEVTSYRPASTRTAFQVSTKNRHIATIRTGAERIRVENSVFGVGADRERNPRSDLLLKLSQVVIEEFVFGFCRRGIRGMVREILEDGKGGNGRE